MSVGKCGTNVLQKLIGHTSDVTSCDFAANYTLVTGSSDKTVRVWDWIPGSGYVERSNSPLRDHKYQVTCVRVSPQGSMFASASVDGTAVLWNLHSARKLYTMVQVNGDAIRVCSFAPDSSILVTAGDNGAVCVWDLVHRSLIRTIFEHEGTTQSLAFTSDSQYLVSACSLEVIRVWYVQDLVDTTSIDSQCAPIARYDNAHDLGVFCVDINKVIRVDEDNPLVKHYTMATSGNSNEIKIWTITSRATPKTKTTTNEVAIELRDTYDGHNSSVTCIRYTNNGRYLVSSSLDKLVKIWDHEGNCVTTLKGHNRYVNCVGVSKDGSLVASGSNDKVLMIWDLTGNLTFDSELFRSPCVSPYQQNGGVPELQMISGAETGENEIKLLEKIDDIAEGAINSCAFNCDGVLATGSGDKLVRLFRITEENNTVEEMNSSPLEAHSYAVNYVEFSRDGTRLASCSLDGCTNIWDPLTGEKLVMLPENSLSIKVCRFSLDARLLIAAGDDEKAIVWNAHTAEVIANLEGHLDTVTSASFSPDTEIVVTASTNADFIVWKVGTYERIFTQDNVHDGGVQCCDFSQNLEPIPNTLADVQSYLLATCGNDGLVKLWRISFSKKDTTALDFDSPPEVKTWRSLQGHGGNVTFVRFSPIVSEIVCSTATDRQARIWSIYSAECLHVLDHDSIVTSCAFTRDCSVLATGCLDKTLWLWKLPQQLVFQTIVANKIKCRSKAIVDWRNTDVVKWLKNIDLPDIAARVRNTSLDGQKILTYSEEQICSGLELDVDQTERLTKEIRWLKRDELRNDNSGLRKSCTSEIPHEFLCPITHEIMRDPVTCSDGFTYEKNAICEWFMAGKYTSPMTNEVLTNTEYELNRDLRNAIHSFLDHLDVDGDEE